MLLSACDNNSPSGVDNKAQEENSSIEDARKEPDISTSRLSENGMFRVSIRSRLDPIQLNQLHSWIIHIETTNGGIVKNAKITVGGGMPEHNHGFSTVPRMTDYLENGDYLVQGVKFIMPGWWEMRLNIAVDKKSDKVVFNIIMP